MSGTDELKDRPSPSTARRVLPWVLLLVLAIVVMSFWGGYKQRVAEKAALGSRPATSAPAASSSKTPAKTATKAKSTPGAATVPETVGTGGENTSKTQVLVVSGVNLRKDPSGSAQVLRVLNQGEKLTLLSSLGSWYKVADTNGNVGWVTASTKYTQIVRN